MTRPSQLLSEPPPPKPPIPPTSTLLDPLLYLGGTLENLIVTEHLTKTKVSGWQLEMTGLAASVQSIPHTASFTHVLLFLFLFFSPLGEAGNVGKTPPKHTDKSTYIQVHRQLERPSTHRHNNHPEVCQFNSLFLLPWKPCLCTFNISPDCQTAASSTLSAQHRLKQKRRRARPRVSELEEVGADYAATEEAFRSC